ncbi:MAG TPA: AtpZ/AtpI family protein [Ktedonobacterales bacterium]
MKNTLKQPLPENQENTSVTAMAIAAQVGLGIVLPLAGGGLIGWYIDSHMLHNAVPIATLLGLGIGLLIGVYGLMRLVALLK